MKPKPSESEGRSSDDGGTASGMKLASAGFELASYALILGGAGYAVDNWLQNSQPYVGIAGLILGFCLGFYRLLKLAGEWS